MKFFTIITFLISSLKLGFGQSPTLKQTTEFLKGKIDVSANHSASYSDDGNGHKISDPYHVIIEFNGCDVKYYKTSNEESITFDTLCFKLSDLAHNISLEEVELEKNLKAYYLNFTTYNNARKIKFITGSDWYQLLHLQFTFMTKILPCELRKLLNMLSICVVGKRKFFEIEKITRIQIMKIK